MKPVVSTLDLCDRAAKELRRIGFELRNASMKSEACYYALPGRKSLLRIAAHSKQKDQIGMTNVVSKLTFCGGAGGIDMHSGNMRLHPDKFEQMIALSIGRYLLKSKETL